MPFFLAFDLFEMIGESFSELKIHGLQDYLHHRHFTIHLLLAFYYALNIIGLYVIYKTFLYWKINQAENGKV